MQKRIGSGEAFLGLVLVLAEAIFLGDLGKEAEMNKPQVTFRRLLWRWL